MDKPAVNRKDTPAVAGARRVARHHKAQWGKHAKTCWLCRNSSANTEKMCAEGRHIADLFYAASDVLRDIEKAEKGQKGQGTLWQTHGE